METNGLPDLPQETIARLGKTQSGRDAIAVITKLQLRLSDANDQIRELERQVGDPSQLAQDLYAVLEKHGIGMAVSAGFGTAACLDPDDASC